MEYRNARYIDEARIDCEIEHPVYGWVPYTLDPADVDMTVNNEDLLALMEERGDVFPYVPPTPEQLEKEAAAAIRLVRDWKLQKEVDVVSGNALRWASLTVEKQQQWANYRQLLLDVPQQIGFPNDVIWPTKPE